MGVAWCRFGHEAGGGGGVMTACGPGQAVTLPTRHVLGGLLVKSGRATADSVTGRAGAHEGSRRAQGPRAGTSAPAEGSRLSREQTARCLGGLVGAVVRPRRTGAGGVVKQCESGCPSGEGWSARLGWAGQKQRALRPATRATACAGGAVRMEDF